MQRTLRTARAAAAIVIASVMALTGGIGAGVAAAQDGPTVVSFGQTLKRCDFSDIKNVGGTGYGRPTAQVRTQGGDVVADVQIATALPNTRYEVRLIQAPRSSAASCNPGDPGVAGAALFTDAVGAGALTLRGPIMSGATGAWVFITRPSPYSQVPEEFYATDFIAKL
ncbi:hypothetical protein [Mycolicibacterium sp. CR10]|uniref:hypothetical protein n=1 Tax=Mycolicibacterium sp. CR10 TaxID=2562314 RepID=UPI0010C0E361|nr:hypothetical protein [Mycolicibacterium sp. CR10]